jgi:hypothetical protein
LVLTGVAIAAGLIGRLVFRRPWIVEATSTGRPPQTLVWKVPGWRRSGRLIDEITEALAAGQDPRRQQLTSELTVDVEWA